MGLYGSQPIKFMVCNYKEWKAAFTCNQTVKTISQTHYNFNEKWTGWISFTSSILLILKNK